MISDALSAKLHAFPQMAISDNHVYFTWLEKSDNNSTNVVFAKSDDGANSIGKPLYLTQNLGNAGVPKILATGSHVYLTWEDNSKGNFEVFLSKSDDYGASFRLPVQVSATTGESGTPQIAVSKDNVYAIWMDNTSGNYDILFAKSTDGGKSFGSPVNISNQHADSGYPQFVVDGNNVYVTWTQTISSQNYDIFFAKSANNGDTFDTPVNISNNFGGSGWPKIAYDGNIYISWVDSTHGRFDVLITKSSDGGKTFDNSTNVSNSKLESYDSKMAALNNSVYLEWQEGNRGNHTIVFSKSTTFVPEFGPLASVALIVSLVAIIAISSRSKLGLNL
jgi:predicted secreted protein with PEFG-CTERM motif